MKLNPLFFALVIGLYFSFSPVLSQDVEPRRWVSIPLGTKVIAAGYIYTSGDVLLDPSLQAENVEIAVNTLVVSYVQSLRIGTKSARLGILLPWNFENWNGLLDGNPESLYRAGLVDPRIRFSINLLGPPATDIKGLQKYYQENPTHTVVGVSLAVHLPLGQYDRNQLINIGNNRFIFRPQIGFEHRWGLWSYELTGSVFLYTKNNKFFPDQQKIKDPVYALQNHLIKRFKSGIWLALNIGYGYGGEGAIDQRELNDYRSDLLFGGSFGVRLNPTQAIKLSYFRKEALNDIGSEVNSLGVVWTKSF